MKLVLLFQYVFSYNCVNSIKIEGFEFQDNAATTHLTEDNGIASINFLVSKISNKNEYFLTAITQGYPKGVLLLLVISQMVKMG